MLGKMVMWILGDKEIHFANIDRKDRNAVINDFNEPNTQSGMQRDLAIVYVSKDRAQ